MEQTQSIGKRLAAIFVDILQTIGIAAAIFVLLYTFILRLHQVYGHSMEPNFRDREYVATDILSYRFKEPKRGEVIVLKSPTDPDKDFIKRIIGLSGERIKIIQGSIYINGKRLDEGLYINDDIKTSPGTFLKEDEEILILDDSYIVIGDNRNNSSDSREWGMLKKTNIVGRPFLVIWPPGEIGAIPSVNYFFP